MNHDARISALEENVENSKSSTLHQQKEREYKLSAEYFKTQKFCQPGLNFKQQLHIKTNSLFQTQLPFIRY